MKIVRRRFVAGGGSGQRKNHHTTMRLLVFRFISCGVVSASRFVVGLVPFSLELRIFRNRNDELKEWHARKKRRKCNFEYSQRLDFFQLSPLILSDLSPPLQFDRIPKRLQWDSYFLPRSAGLCQESYTSLNRCVSNSFALRSYSPEERPPSRHDEKTLTG